MSEAPPVQWRLWGNEPPLGWQVPIWERRKEIWAPGGPDLFAACGPRAGKDRLTVWLNLDGLLDLYFQRRESGSSLIPNVYSWIVAPTSDDYEQVFREYKVHTEGLPRHILQARGEQRIILFGERGREEQTGIWLDFKSGWNADRMVASGLDSAHVTEGAKLPTETYELLLSRMASPGRRGKMLVNGTPGDCPAAWYRRLFRCGEAGDASLVFANEPSWSNLALGDEQLHKLIEIHGRVSDRRWSTNWGARLLTEGGGLFKELSRVSTGALEIGAPGAAVLVAYDPAGEDTNAENDKDYHVLGAWRYDGAYRTHPRQVDLLRWRGCLWDESERRIKEFVVRNRAREFHWDANGRVSMGTDLRRLLPGSVYINPVTWTNPQKADMVDHAVKVTEVHGCTLLAPDSCDHASAQFAEMQDFQMTRTKSGHVSFNAPTKKREGEEDKPHDDTVSQVCIALAALANPRGTGATQFDRVTGGSVYAD